MKEQENNTQKKGNSNKVIIIAIIAVVAIVGIIIAANAVKKNQERKDQIAQSESMANQGEANMTPLFTFFMSNDDSNFAEMTQAVEELKKDYGDRVEFDIRNVTEHPEELQRFPVENQTPALFMTDRHGNICNVLMKVTDKADLKASIEKGLND